MAHQVSYKDILREESKPDEAYLRYMVARTPEDERLERVHNEGFPFTDPQTYKAARESNIKPTSEIVLDAVKEAGIRVLAKVPWVRSVAPQVDDAYFRMGQRNLENYFAERTDDELKEIAMNWHIITPSPGVVLSGQDRLTRDKMLLKYFNMPLYGGGDVYTDTVTGTIQAVDQLRGGASLARAGTRMFASAGGAVKRGVATATMGTGTHLGVTADSEANDLTSRTQYKEDEALRQAMAFIRQLALEELEELGD